MTTIIDMYMILFTFNNLLSEVEMYTEEHTEMLIQIATLLDLEIEEVTKFIEIMLGGYNFEDGVNGCSLTTEECKLILAEIQKRKPKV